MGRNVKRFRPGDEVFGEVDGAFAEYVCAQDNVVEPKPAGLSFEQAAAVPLAGNTALMGLRDLGRVQPGQRVLVNGASGGVGTFAVQIAKAFGAEVTGVCSTRNMELVRSMGADHLVDCTREDFTRNGRRYDVVFDLVGNHSLTECRRALTPTGGLLRRGRIRRREPCRADGSHPQGQAMSRFVRHLGCSSSRRRRARRTGSAERTRRVRKLTPVIDRTYPLSEVPEAIRYLEVEHARSKVVITV